LCAQLPDESQVVGQHLLALAPEYDRSRPGTQKLGSVDTLQQCAPLQLPLEQVEPSGCSLQSLPGCCLHAPLTQT
jgi:hypothetical protein